MTVTGSNVMTLPQAVIALLQPVLTDTVTGRDGTTKSHDGNTTSRTDTIKR